MGDQAGGESEKGFVDVVASFPADAQAAEAVEPGDGALDGVAEDTQAGAVWLAPSGDHGPDAALPGLAAVDVVVVAVGGQQSVRPPAGPADPARDGGDLVEQRLELGDVVAVAAGQRYRERDALAVDDETSDGVKRSSCGSEWVLGAGGEGDGFVVVDVLVDAVMQAPDHAVEEIPQG